MTFLLGTFSFHYITYLHTSTSNVSHITSILSNKLHSDTKGAHWHIMLSPFFSIYIRQKKIDSDMLFIFNKLTCCRWISNSCIIIVNWFGKKKTHHSFFLSITHFQMGNHATIKSKIPSHSIWHGFWHFARIKIAGELE